MRQGVQSLVELTVVAVALYTPVQELLEYVEFLPSRIRDQLFRELSNFRLREMEMAWEAAAQQEPPEPRDGYEPQAGDKFLFDRETQRVWEQRMNTARLGYEPISIENTAAAHGRRRNTRHVFWEHQFRSLLKLRTPLKLAGPVDVLAKCQKLFVNVVEVLKVHGREVCEDNVKLILALRKLRRLEVHHPEQQNTCWKTMGKLIQEHSHLTELGFFHGKLSDNQIAQIRNTLVVVKATPTLDTKLDVSRITTLELVSVKIRSEGFRQLVGLVMAMPQLTQLRLSNTITDFDTKLLIDAAFRAPKLQRLFLEHNELEDDAFIGLTKVRKPLALRHLRLSDNDVSSTTVRAICGATMDGVLNLQRLELANNVQIGDPGIHALTPMLASPDTEQAAVLTHLDVRGCNFGLEGATNLLLALGQNKTVKHLNVAQNFFDVGFGDVLADFLLTNESVTHLQANGVGLGLAGVSARLLTALESNTTLTSISMGANRLRNDGAAAIVRSLVKRAQVKPFTLVDLSGNLLTLNGLATIADILENLTSTNARYTGSSTCRRDSIDGEDQIDRKRQRTYSVDNHKDSLSPRITCSKPIEELCLLNNDFIRNDEYVGDSSMPVESIRRCVGHFKSNEWATQHQVYDDEV
ncbi:NLRC3 protein [Phytophthora nicotianae]|uniref:NLRC3 protein n=1 Tax=Phytophthora nicotianae TaxID=4792 RepID=A0A0W8BWC0_PHYNI|nr:NLRC3 protein [Phytophthora nicotianae]